MLLWLRDARSAAGVLLTRRLPNARFLPGVFGSRSAASTA
jgi:hypothetical protein